MPNLSIKDVPAPLAEALRQRAARNHRSLQGELMAIIETAALEGGESDSRTPTSADRRGVVVGYGAGGHPIIRQGWKTVEQVSAELRAIYPVPVQGQPLGVDIVRADRDSR